MLKRPQITPRIIALTVSLLAVGSMSVADRMDDGQARPIPQPAPDCVRVVDTAGETDWYCGQTIRVPRGAHVFAPNVPRCMSDDGSGPLPCRWDATSQGRVGPDGKRHGRSFTVLPDGSPVNGTQHVLFRYDDGVTVQATVPAS